ncbi:TPA: hypothetical protein ACQ53F_002318 [Legionella pneumophila]|uniref:Uncharacterized protein n=1 Tax=Legionella pneumophila TaxID=446 RepID=A0AAN5KSU9_LEGPN|nr:hypothetical protein [Legionella pneumophila]HAT1971288.1 hypothetical protein [Legionella pneumophila]HAT6956579.1 hypothetical protein [Legionella pneumophila]HEN4769594.1 hypothetical protein [Legionella pneumophila]
MTLILKMKKFKLMAKEQCFAFIKNAVNVGMDEVIYSKGTNRTFITDGLATCAAVAIYGSDGDCSAAFTHMSSEATDKDDKRKEKILNEMLEYVLKSNALSNVKLIISPSRIQEKHLISFILEWVKQKKIACTMVAKGGDSAVFNMDEDGRVLMLSTSLQLKQDASDKTWHGHGIIIGQSEGNSVVEKQKKHFIFFADEISSQITKLSDSPKTVGTVAAVSA